MSQVMRTVVSWKADMQALHEAMHPALETPALLLWGDCDRAVPVGSAVELRRVLPLSVMQVLEGVGHLPAEEVPEVSARMLVEWMEDGATGRIELRAIGALRPALSPASMRVSPVRLRKMVGAFDPHDLLRVWCAG